MPAASEIGSAYAQMVLNGLAVETAAPAGS
jgi:hypothetical protein